MRKFLPCMLLLAFLFLPDMAWASRISELSDSSLSDRALRFFTFQDPSLRYALMGSILIGICCGLMGAFLIVRKLALMGDALSHAVLPGVALGFLWNMSKDPIAIFIGASIAGLLGAGTVQLIRNTTRHKEDAALGFVLASFFGLGICLFTMIQRLPGSNKSGIDKFMFGQAAAMGKADVILLAVVTVVAVATVIIFFKEFRLTSFDANFGRSSGLPVQLFHYGLMLLLAFAIVASLQAVGVVLVSAMLVIPAAAAYLLTDYFGTMLLMSAIFGMCSGVVGAFFSFVGKNMPTGPLMVIAAGVVFVMALFFGPRHGILSRIFRQYSRSARISRENTLKAIYHVMEGEEFRNETISLRALAERRRETIEDADKQVRALRKHDMATLSNGSIAFTPAGWQRACEIVRNHRLWELYLTHAANYAPDHVHEDAEKIEHILGEETVYRLEKLLNYARTDPHGKLIPGIRDIRSGYPGSMTERATGFGGNATS